MTDSILDLPYVLSTRRNHALEHATLHMLERKHPKQPMGGHSNPTGFLIFGDFSLEEIQAALRAAPKKYHTKNTHRFQASER